MKIKFHFAIAAILAFGATTSRPSDTCANPNDGPTPSNRSLLKEIKSDGIHSEFLRPNERNLEYLPAILEDLREGAYLTVGTERGFMTAAMLPKINRVFFTDMNPEAVLYNRINISLLTLAKNHADYVRLRTKASAAEISARLLLGTGRFTPRQIAWFTNALRKREGADILSTKPSVISPSANYVTNAEAGDRLISLAKAGRLTAHRVDLGDSQAVEIFQRDVLSNDVLTLVDVSNAWWDAYLGVRRTKNFLKPLSQNHPEALVIATSRVPDLHSWFYMTFPISIAQNQKRWIEVERALSQRYVVFTSRKIRNWTSKIMAPPPMRISINAYPLKCEALFKTVESR